MQVKFYNTTSDNTEVKKKLASIKTTNCQIWGDCSIQSPSFLILMDDDLIDANYVYVPSFGRYYYITNKTITGGNKLMITCRVDVLMSFWSSFKNSPCIAKRSSSKYTRAIDDPYVLKKPTCVYDFRRLAKSFTPTDSEGHYVLIVGGAN